MSRRVSPDGLLVLRYFEGREREAYPDPASPRAIARRKGLPTLGLSGAPWTIGTGHTGPEVCEGLVWTDAQIDAAEAADLLRFERDVETLVGAHPIKQGQFDALTLFAFNVGSDIDDDTKAEGLGDSTLLRKFLAGDILGAAAEFPKWDRAGGVPVLGVHRRRVAEQVLFNGHTAATAIAMAKLIQHV